METIKSIFWTIIKFALLATLISCLIAGFTPLRIDASWIFIIIILAMVLRTVRRWLPYPFNLLKRLGAWTLKAMAGWLWSKTERRGGANIRQSKMRWRS